MTVTPPPDGDAGQPPPPPPAYPSAPAPSPYPAAPSPYPSAYPSAPVYGAASYGPPGPAPGLAYAGFGRRFVGYLIDQLILIAVELIVTIPYAISPIVKFYQDHPVAAGQPAPTLPSELVGRFAIVGLVGAVLAALYYGGLVAWQGRTLGQRVVGTFVVRAEDGGRLPLDRALIRSVIFWGPGVLGLVPYLGQLAGLIALIGLISVAWDQRKQGWHDKLGRSFVVRRVGV